MRPIPDTACLACGELIEDTLVRLGSPRCLDCRQASRPLDRRLADAALIGDAEGGAAAALGLVRRPLELPD